jgi:hypothetical protein
MPCPNCANEHAGEFCSACGQRNVDLHVPIGGLVREAAEEALGVDSRLRHTLVPFFFRPGEVTRDYLSGRRVRYTSPLKMYLVAAAVFFFAFASQDRPNVIRIDAKDKARPAAAGKIDNYFLQRVDRFEKLGPDGPRLLATNMAGALPKALVLLLPIFALLLKLFWRKFYYAEHLVFALHYHAFALLLLTPGSLLPGAAGNSANGIALMACLVYLFLALRRVYGGGIGRTLLKFFGLGFSYSILLCLGIAAAGLASLALL